MSNVNFTSADPLLLSPTGIQTNSFKPKAATAYKRGDLLVVSATGVLTHSVAAQNQADWHVVCLEDCTAAQADANLAKGEGIPVYTHGEINLDAVKLNGTLLTDAQKPLAKARSAMGTSVTLRKPFKTA